MDFFPTRIHTVLFRTRILLLYLNQFSDFLNIYQSFSAVIEISQPFKPLLLKIIDSSTCSQISVRSSFQFNRFSSPIILVSMSRDIKIHRNNSTHMSNESSIPSTSATTKEDATIIRTSFWTRVCLRMIDNASSDCFYFLIIVMKVKGTLVYRKNMPNVLD